MLIRDIIVRIQIFVLPHPCRQFRDHFFVVGDDIAEIKARSFQGFIRHDVVYRFYFQTVSLEVVVK